MDSIDQELLGLVNTVRAHKDLPPVAEFSAGAQLRGDLGFNSLDLAELTVRIEERFRVDVFKTGVVYTLGEVRERIAEGSSGR